MLFTLKKILGLLIMPMPVFGCMLVAGAVCFLRGKQRAGRILIGSALALLLLLSLPLISSLLVIPLEYAYPKYDERPVNYVIVLGGYHSSDENVPLSSLLSAVSMVRLSEGIRIYRHNPGAKLLLSGHNGRDEISQAEAMARVAEMFGVPRDDMVLEPRARDTAEEAMYWSEYVGAAPTALVTSAVHMRRAMDLFIQHGKTPVAAPTEYMSRKEFNPDWHDWIPTVWALNNVQRAWHEYVGIVWAWLNR